MSSGRCLQLTLLLWLNEGRDSLNPPYQSGREADRGQVVACQPVIARCDAPEVLQPVEGILDEPSQLVEALVEAERLLSAAPVRNDGLRSTLLQRFAQLGAIIGLIGEHVFGRFRFANEAAGQQSCASPPVNRMASRRPLASASAWI